MSTAIPVEGVPVERRRQGATEDGGWEAELDRREVLDVQPDSTIAVKQDTRHIWVDAAAQDFIRAFADAMARPDASFGPIRVLRKHERRGLPFAVGERFQGRFSLWLVLLDAARRSHWMMPVARWVERGGERPSAQRLHRLLHRAETLLTSDFGQIVELETQQLPARLRYVYLTGSYMAGFSSFVVEPAGEQRCLVTCTWQYQEKQLLTVLWIGTSVLKMHWNVVYHQIAASAALLGASVVETDIPDAYLGGRALHRGIAEGSPERARPMMAAQPIEAASIAEP